MNKEVALYIHVPFCKQKCFYCDFPSYSGKESLMKDYAKALSKEISTVKNKISTIFIGGGTPTYLSLDSFCIIKKALDKLDKSSDLEFTIEGNPGTFTEEKLEFFKEMGVNRLSIGLQAWQDHILKSLGRIHNLEEFKKSYYMARKKGFKNINVDLMFGLPNQKNIEWKETLENVINMDPDHISCYSLIIEEGTVFYEKLHELNLPSEEDERKMYYETIEFLKDKGYLQYEISNFSKKGRKCRHNLVYWSLEDYIGCGAAAHSYYNGERYRNETDICKYINLIEKTNNPVVEVHKNSIKENMEEYMFMGLRKIEGISKEKFKEKFSEDIYDIYGKTIEKYKSLDLIKETNKNIFLSRRGIELSNVVMSDFILDEH